MLAPDARDDLLDRLDDLRHDLGKHIRLPLALLPRDATPAQVREALAAGLRRTRVGPDGVRTARAVFDAFRAPAAAALSAFAAWPALEAAVTAALDLERALAPGAPDVDRAAADATLSAVSAAIRALREEVARG